MENSAECISVNQVKVVQKEVLERPEKKIDFLMIQWLITLNKIKILLY